MAFMDRPILAIDFDGTIRQGKRYLSKNNRLMPYCKWVIKKLHKKGCRFIVWTCRNEDSLDLVRKVLKENGISQCFEQINENIKELQCWNTKKVYADYYIDDLNLGGFPGWMKVYRIVMQDDYFKKEKV